MDIAKYVGLFLLKSEYCFLPGIGSLQIHKSPAVFNKETKQMDAPTYSVRFAKGAGSIDDSFANFIANNERISIAHASNYLREFCAQAKADLKQRKEVEIPGIGKFVSIANEVIQFVADPHLHIEGKSIPVFKNVAAKQEQQGETLSNIIERTTFKEPKADEEIEYKAPKINWGKIILLSGVLLLIVAAAIYMFVTFGMGDKDEQPVQTEQQPAPTINNDATQVTPTDTAIDANINSTDSGNSVNNTLSRTTNADGTISYKVLLQTYNSQVKADTRVSKLKSYGNSNVEVLVKDSTNYYVVMNMTSAAIDTTKIVDSIKRLFNPGGNVYILK